MKIVQILVGVSVGGLIGHFIDTYNRVKKEQELDAQWYEQHEAAVEKNLYFNEPDPEGIKDAGEPHVVLLKSDRDKRTRFQEEVKENTKESPEVETLSRDLEYIMMMNFRNRYTGEELEFMLAGLTPQEQLAQYKAMRMAEISDLDLIQVLYILFDIEYEFPGSADQSLYDTVMNERKIFFEDDSELALTISFAELILNFASTMSTDFGEPIDNYLIELLDNLGISPQSSLHEITRIKNDIFYNKFEGPNGFGLFALSEPSSEPLNRQYFDYHGFADIDTDY